MPKVGSKMTDKYLFPAKSFLSVRLRRQGRPLHQLPESQGTKGGKQNYWELFRGGFGRVYTYCNLYRRSQGRLQSWGEFIYSGPLHWSSHLNDGETLFPSRLRPAGWHKNSNNCVWGKTQLIRQLLEAKGGIRLGGRNDLIRFGWLLIYYSV